MHDIAPSYHRAIYLDLNLIAYLKEPNQQSSINTRLLSTKCPYSTRTYKKYIENYFIKNGIITKVQSIQNTIENTTIDETDLPIINVVDQLITKGLLLAEKNIKHYKSTHP